MLYPVTTDPYTPALQWLLNLQQRLVFALCNPLINADDINEAWVADLALPDRHAQNWCRNFFARVRDRKSISELVQEVASLSTDKKQHVLTVYQNNVNCLSAYLHNDPFQLLRFEGLGESEKSAIQSLLKAFYLIALQNGLPVDCQGVCPGQFTRLDLVDLFQAGNNITHCVYTATAT